MERLLQDVEMSDLRGDRASDSPYRSFDADSTEHSKDLHRDWRCEQLAAHARPLCYALPTDVFGAPLPPNCSRCGGALDWLANSHTAAPDAAADPIHVTPSDTFSEAWRARAASFRAEELCDTSLWEEAAWAGSSGVYVKWSPQPAQHANARQFAQHARHGIDRDQLRKVWKSKEVKKQKRRCDEEADAWDYLSAPVCTCGADAEPEWPRYSSDSSTWMGMALRSMQVDIPYLNGFSPSAEIHEKIKTSDEYGIHHRAMTALMLLCIFAGSRIPPRGSDAIFFDLHPQLRKVPLQMRGKILRTVAAVMRVLVVVSFVFISWTVSTFIHSSGVLVDVFNGSRFGVGLFSAMSIMGYTLFTLSFVSGMYRTNQHPEEIDILRIMCTHCAGSHRLRVHCSWWIKVFVIAIIVTSIVEIFLWVFPLVRSGSASSAFPVIENWGTTLIVIAASLATINVYMVSFMNFCAVALQLYVARTVYCGARLIKSPLHLLRWRRAFLHSRKSMHRTAQRAQLYSVVATFAYLFTFATSLYLSIVLDERKTTVPGSPADALRRMFFVTFIIQLCQMVVFSIPVVMMFLKAAEISYMYERCEKVLSMRVTTAALQELYDPVLLLASQPSAYELYGFPVRRGVIRSAATVLISSSTVLLHYLFGIS